MAESPVLESTIVLEQWLKHRRVLEALLERIPDDQLQFRPWDGAMNFNELVQHMATSAEMFLKLAKNGTGVIQQNEAVLCKTTQELSAIVNEYTRSTQAIFESLTADELDAVYESSFPTLSGPRRNLVKLVRDHEVHHKGQLFVYARLMGIKEIPFFV